MWQICFDDINRGFPHSLQENGVNLLQISAVNPQKYALALMDALFTEEEMSESCFKESKRSTKPPLDKERVKLLEGIIT